MAKICIIDDEKSICESLEWILEKQGHEVSYATSFTTATELINNEVFNLYFVDLVLPGGSGIDLIKLIKERNKDSKVIVITGYPSTPTLVDSVRLCVYDYLSKPIDSSSIINITEHALEDKNNQKKEDFNEQTKIKTK